LQLYNFWSILFRFLRSTSSRP